MIPNGFQSRTEKPNHLGEKGRDCIHRYDYYAQTPITGPFTEHAISAQCGDFQWKIIYIVLIRAIEMS